MAEIDEVLVDLFTMPGWSVLKAELAKLEADEQSTVVAYATSKEMDDIRLASGRLLGIGLVINHLEHMEEDARVQRQGR